MRSQLLGKVSENSTRSVYEGIRLSDGTVFIQGDLIFYRLPNVAASAEQYEQRESIVGKIKYIFHDHDSDEIKVRIEGDPILPFSISHESVSHVTSKKKREFVKGGYEQYMRQEVKIYPANSQPDKGHDLTQSGE
jgi:hypothetical protein